MANSTKYIGVPQTLTMKLTSLVSFDVVQTTPHHRDSRGAPAETLLTRGGRGSGGTQKRRGNKPQWKTPLAPWKSVSVVKSKTNKNVGFVFQVIDKD